MKIGIVCYPTYGGSGVIATELGKGLAKKGHQVHFITYRQPVRLSPFQENVFYHETTIPDYPLFEYTPYDSSLTSKLVDVVKYENLDLLHVHYAIPHATVGYIAKKILMEEKRYVPVITTLHGTDITLVGSDPAFSPVVSFSINKSDGVTAVSQSLKQQTIDYFQIKNHIEVIPNFIDFSRFRRKKVDHFRQVLAPNAERILIHASNFRKVKRIEDVVYIFQKVHEKIPSKLLLVGDGPERKRIEDLCRQIDLYEEVRFLGKQDAIEDLLSLSDLFLMPSESESFGLAALEAMACEVPVISSNTGGLPEVNIHGKTGFLSNVGDVAEMADYALQILSSDETLQQFKTAALHQAEQFDIQYILPMYEQYYNHVLSNIQPVM